MASATAAPKEIQSGSTKFLKTIDEKKQAIYIAVGHEEDNSLKFKYVWDAQRKKAYFTNVATNKMVWKLPDIAVEETKKEEKEANAKRIKEEEEQRKKDEEEAKIKREQDAIRQKEEAELKLKQEAELKLKQEQEEKERKELEEKNRLELAERKRLAAEDDKKRKEEEKKKREEDARKKREEDKRKREEEAKKKEQQELELKKRQDAIKQKREEEERKKIEEAERLIKEKEEKERLQREEEERKVREEQERIENERLAKEREEAERIRIEQERIEAERREKERIEQERLERERLERERIEREEAERKRKEEEERLERERILELERIERERIEAEKREAERIELERIEAERKEAERIERERIARERAIAKELARIEAERLAAERKAREEARREADRIKREEAKRKIEEEKAKKEEKERLKFEAQEAIRQEKEDALRRKIEEAPSTPKRASVVRQLQLTPGPVTPQRKEQKHAFEKLFERPRPSPRTPPQKQKERANRSEGERKIREWMASDKPQHPWKRTCAELVKYLSAHLQNIDSIDALQQLATPRTHLLLQTPERKFVIPSNTAAIQYIEQEDIDNVNIVYKVRGDQRITKAATLSKIIEKISVANFELEREFIESFFLTYRCYTNPEAIFDMFLQRYELIREKKHDKLAMQNILMFWWEFCFQIDWMPSNRMMITIGKFLESARKDGEKAFVTEFLKLIDKQVALHHKESQEVTDLTLLSNYSVQICQSVLERPSPLFDLDESALAKQLTLIDVKLLCRIRYTELLHPKLFAPYLDRESTYENALRVGASNVVSLLSRYDALANWTASAIVAPTTMDTRVKRMVFMTKTCHLLIDMNNHHTALAMAEGLLNPAVLRLKVTRSHLPIQAQRSLEFIRQFYEKHDRQDREVTMMQLLDDEEIPSHLLGMTPCLPFIHPILKRLTIVEDAYLPRIKVTGEKLIHLDKYVQIFRTQNLIREFQSVCNFGFTWNDSIYTKLQKNMTYRQTQAVIMKWSCKRE